MPISSACANAPATKSTALKMTTTEPLIGAVWPKDPAQPSRCPARSAPGVKCDHKRVKVMRLDRDYQLCRKCGGMRETPNK